MSMSRMSARAMHTIEVRLVKTQHYTLNWFRRVGPRTLLRTLRRFRIRLAQDRLLNKSLGRNVERLIILLTPGKDIVNGGIMSICSIYEETRTIYQIHGAEAVMCTVPGDPILLRYTRFKNSVHLYRFSQVLSHFKNLQHLIVHVPECYPEQFLKNLDYRDYLHLRKVKRLHFNILLQNIDYLSPIAYLQELAELGRLTFTTAHDTYTTKEMRNKLGFPMHKLSTFLTPEKYVAKTYREKEDSMIVSPDPHPSKSRILRMIAEDMPHLRIQIIQNLKYEEYKELISRAKWALTFGEGLDGYFVESVFSGGISFSVYNPRFFTKDFRPLRTVYDNYDLLAARICSDIQKLDSEPAYATYQQQQYDLCNKYYSHEQYAKNLQLFYEGKYTYP